MSIPVEHGDSRDFQFKTAPLREGEGQSSLECVHQALASPLPQDHMVNIACGWFHDYNYGYIIIAELLGYNGA